MTIYCQVNATDYDGIVIEAMNYYASGPAVPPWEEWGEPCLAGPFLTESQAQAALEAADDDPTSNVGVWFMPERDCPNFD